MTVGVRSAVRGPDSSWGFNVSAHCKYHVADKHDTQPSHFILTPDKPVNVNVNQGSVYR